MDLNEQDRACLNAKVCPDCGAPIKIYVFDNSRPVCGNCDVWFEYDRSGWVIRNADARDTCRREWERKWRDVLNA